MSDQPVFRRFGADRQEQIQQLLTYVQLLGLSGRDLVSIGQTLTRITVSADLKHKRSIARDLATQARPVQAGVHVTRMFEWTGPTGHVHVFSRAGLDTARARVVSYRDATKSKQLTSSQPGHGVSQLVIYLPGYARRTWMYNVLLNIHYGDLAL